MFTREDSKEITRLINECNNKIDLAFAEQAKTTKLLNDIKKVLSDNLKTTNKTTKKTTK